MKSFWTFISTLLAGVVAGLLIFLKLKGPDQVVNDNTRIGKMKQRGQGNDSSITVPVPQGQPFVVALDADTPSERREDRIRKRLARIRERRDKKESG